MSPFFCGCAMHHVDASHEMTFADCSDIQRVYRKPSPLEAGARPYLTRNMIGVSRKHLDYRDGPEIAHRLIGLVKNTTVHLSYGDLMCNW